MIRASRLRDFPVLEYLYYLGQVGLGLCPLSNDALFLKMKDSPIPRFIRRGLNVRATQFIPHSFLLCLCACEHLSTGMDIFSLTQVTLGTDDPLQFHSSNHAQQQEYTVAQRVWGLGMQEMCEVRC